MLISMCMAKIHRAKVTQAHLDYPGSITIDQDILEACGMRPRQYVNITNCSNAVFWRTYIMAGKRGNGDICLNGPPARIFQVGDEVMILAEAWVTPEEASVLKTKIVWVDGKNKVTKTLEDESELHPLS